MTIIRKIMSEIDIKLGLENVLKKIEDACKRRPQVFSNVNPLLVAVGKTHPTETIINTYEFGQRHFGENYVKELVEKGHNQDLIEKCPEIKWHFIGLLQTNKINKIINVPGIHMIETVESEKLATALNNAWQKKNPTEKLKILIQVNTSGETEKNGIPSSEVTSLYGFVKKQCPNLSLEGLMTIGKYGYDVSEGPNPDFIKLKKCQEDVCKEFGLEIEQVQLSMGMSADYEHAIEVGSAIVRVGTSIFGYRPMKVKAVEPKN